MCHRFFVFSKLYSNFIVSIATSSGIDFSIVLPVVSECFLLRVFFFFIVLGIGKRFGEYEV